MSRILMRAILASLLLMTVASKTQTLADAGRDRLISNVLEVLAEYQVNAQANVLAKDAVLPVAVHFQAPGCEGPVEVMPVDINLQVAPLFDTVVKPNYVRQFVYLDQTWSSENRLGMRLTWLRHRALFTLGLGRFVTNKTGLLVASPPGCHIAPAIDWSLVWDRRTMAATEAKVMR